MHGNTRKDFELHYPLILRQFDKERLADSFDSEILPHPVPLRWKRGRGTVKRSSKQSAASRHIHELESKLDFKKIFPEKKKALLLVFHRFLDKRDGYFAVTNIGDFEVLRLPDNAGWVALWQGVRHKFAYGKSPATALARLMGKKWAEFKLENRQSYYASLYDFYREIHFEFAENPKKRPRNWTDKIRPVPHFRMAWESITSKTLCIRAYTPPANPNNKPRINFGNFATERSRI